MNYERRKYDQLKVKKFNLRRIYNVSDVKTMVGGTEHISNELEADVEPEQEIFSKEKDIFEEDKNNQEVKGEEVDEQKLDDLSFNIELLRRLKRKWES